MRYWDEKFGYLCLGVQFRPKLPEMFLLFSFLLLLYFIVKFVPIMPVLHFMYLLGFPLSSFAFHTNCVYWPILLAKAIIIAAFITIISLKIYILKSECRIHLLAKLQPSSPSIGGGKLGIAARNSEAWID